MPLGKENVMNTRSTARFTGLALTMAAALATSGCGGGSSKPPMPMEPTQLPFRSIDSAVTSNDQRQGIRAAAVEAAGNAPNGGVFRSVTQSSTAGDSVRVARLVRRADGAINWGVGKAGGWSVDGDNARVLAEPRGEGWRGIQFHQAPGGGKGSGTGPGLYVNVYTDIEVPTTRPALVPAALAPADHPEGCGVGGTVSAGHSCTYEANGQTFTLRMDGNSVCFAFGCAGGNQRIIDSTFNGVRVTLVTEGSGASRTIAQLGGDLAAPAAAGPPPADAPAPQPPDDMPAPPDAREPAPPMPVFDPDLAGQDADYLAGGIWVRVPEGAASVADYEFGAFMDGGDPFVQDNLAGLTGRATYTGEASAVYSYQPTNRNYFVDGVVRLTADFGDADSLGSIRGAITDITGEGPERGWYEGGSVVLGTAQIGSADSGFFTGDTSTRSSDPDDPVLTGKWGGRFYGNGAAGAHPGSVAGTFGGATADGSQSYVGIYGAFRGEDQEPPQPR